MTDTTRRDALARTLGPRLERCNWDELRVLDIILERLEIGRDRYGHLDLAKSRDWEREEAEEHFDARVYRACQTIVERDRRVEAVLTGNDVPLKGSAALANSFGNSRGDASGTALAVPTSLSPRVVQTTGFQAARGDIDLRLKSVLVSADWPGPFELGGEE